MGGRQACLGWRGLRWVVVANSKLRGRERAHQRAARARRLNLWSLLRVTGRSIGWSGGGVDLGRFLAEPDGSAAPAGVLGSDGGLRRRIIGASGQTISNS